jgi:acyl-CoA synthetase (AMP-forming)/AMP-acid ligase II
MENISQVLLQAAGDVPDQVSVHLLFSRMPTRSLTYRELWQRAARFAKSLQAAEIQPGEIVILILQHGEDLVTAFFGTILHGAVPSIMPFLTEKLLPEQYRASLAALFEVTAPACIITYPDFVDEASSASRGSSVRKIINIADLPSDLPDFSPDSAEFKGLSALPDTIALLQHSSGTTGLQKGVALSHQAIFNQLGSYAQELALSRQDVIVSWLPLYHDMGLIAGFILPILSHVPLVLMSPFDWIRAPHRLMQAISDYKGTLCWLPNFAYNFCAQKIRDRELQGLDLSSLRAVINCSEPMHWKSHLIFQERFAPFGLRASALATCYAMAENVFAVTQAGINQPVRVDSIDLASFLNSQVATPRINQPADSPNALQMLSAGRPIRGVQLRVVNNKGDDLSERQIGEIAIRSHCMLTGYYHRPDLTEQVFLNGWYLTGDLGYLAEGELYVTGRKKDLIIVGGKNVYPQDLERLAGDVAGVHPGRVVAFGVYNEESGTEDVVIIAETDEEDSEQIATSIRQRVTRGSDIVVRAVHVTARNWLVKTSSGKIARQANKAKYLSEIENSSESEP